MTREAWETHLSRCTLNSLEAKPNIDRLHGTCRMAKLPPVSDAEARGTS